jgi:hypothetical protein
MAARPPGRGPAGRAPAAAAPAPTSPQSPAHHVGAGGPGHRLAVDLRVAASGAVVPSSKIAVTCTLPAVLEVFATSTNVC